jgi:hypothetical protein
MQSKENAWTYLALKQAKEMALQLLHQVIKITKEEILGLIHAVPVCRK